jgi:hypothetical protein
MLSQSTTRRRKTVAAGLAAAAVCTGVVQTLTATPGAAASCLGTENVQRWNVTAGSGTYYSSVFRTTANCRDINFWVGAKEDADPYPSGRVKVCFVAAGYCQSGWKNFYWNQSSRTVVATNVNDGVTFKVVVEWNAVCYGGRYQTGTWA